MINLPILLNYVETAKQIEVVFGIVATISRGYSRRDLGFPKIKLISHRFMSKLQTAVVWHFAHNANSVTNSAIVRVVDSTACCTSSIPLDQRGMPLQLGCHFAQLSLNDGPGTR